MAKNPISRDSLTKFLDTVTPMSPEAAERVVREVLRLGDERRRDAERLVSEVTAAGRRSAEHFTSAVQQEVAKQLGRLVQRIDTLERQLEHVNRNLETTRSVVAAAAGKAVARALPGAVPAAKKSGKATTKKSTAKKTSGKKSTAKKSSGKKSTAKKTPAKSTAPSSSSGANSSAE